MRAVRHTVRIRGARLLDRLGWVGAALAGAVAGHVVTYVVAFANPHRRHAVLDQTGHSYWSVAGLAAVALGVWSAANLIVRHFKGSARQEASDAAFVPLASRLVFLQVLVFAYLEVGERLASGAPIGGLLFHGLLPLGLAIQFLVAVGVALLLRGLAVAAEAIARSLRVPETTWSPGAWRLPTAPHRLSQPLLSGAWGLRGPPSR